MEFFLYTQKEELYKIGYHSIREFEQSVADYIERYNNEGPRATLRYKTHNAFEQEYYDN